MMKVVPVRIGPKYQAELPPLQAAQTDEQAPRDLGSRASRSTAAATLASSSTRQQPAPRYTHRWTPSRFTDDEVTEFLRSFCRLNEIELGLQCLMESDFHVQTAVQLLHDARRAKARTQRTETERVSDEAFGSAIAAHGKKFFVIQQELAHMTTGDVIRRFYLWKTSPAYRIWRERMKARRSKESARLRTWADSDDSDASDFHNEYCELCFTGGQLLCCDGCERAYHFSCVTPPINEIPNGDWFCRHCAAIVDTSLRVQTSDENAHCLDARVVDGGEASDVETLDLDDIEDEDDDDDSGADAKRASRSTGPHDRTACGTDSDESDSASTETKSSRSEREGVRVKDEPRPAHTSLLPAFGRFSSPAKPPLVLEPSSSERKRKRKTEAPRRILPPRAGL